MRLSAKLNLFLGVRNHGEQFLPPHLPYLPSYFRRRADAMRCCRCRCSVGSTAVVVALIATAPSTPAGPGRARPACCVASLLLLAVVEHLLMVLPWQGTALWRWAMKRQHRCASGSRAAGTR